MIWSNKNYLNLNLLTINSGKQMQLIKENDSEFKYWLDRYKYFERHTNHSKDYYFKKSTIFLNKIEQHLKNYPYIVGNKIQLVDIAIFPFIRQFSNVDVNLFNTYFANINNWYLKIVNLNRFKNIMKKYNYWSNNKKPIIENLYNKSL